MNDQELNTSPPKIRLVVVVGIIGAVLALLVIWRMSTSENVSDQPVEEEAQPNPTAHPTLPAMDHPRLFFTGDDLDDLRTAATTTHIGIWVPIRDYAAEEQGYHPPESPPDEVDTQYRDYGNRLIATAFACVIGEDPGDCDSTKRQMLTYATWETWGSNGARDLGLAHLLMANALAYDWMYDSLSAAERSQVAESLGQHAQEMYEASTGERVEEWNNWWQRSYLQNHYWIDHSALGMAGLALLGEDDRAEIWVDHAANRMTLIQTFLEGIGDGTWHEGVHYQNYGLTMSMPFLYNLERVMGENIFPDDYLKNYVRWRIYTWVPDPDVEFLTPYADYDPAWGDGYRSQNLLRLFAARYNDSQAEWMAQQLISLDGRHTTVNSAPWYVFEFLYYDPSIGATPPEGMAHSAVFPDLETVIWRTGWDASALGFALKSGAYGGRFAYDTFVASAAPWETPCVDTRCQINVGHDHDDMGSITLYNDGQWLMPETVGAGNYDTSFHNTILIDGEGQYRPQQQEWRIPEAMQNTDGYLEATTSGTAFDFVVANATNRYSQAAGVRDVTRYVLYVRPNYFVVVDSLAADDAHVYQWVGHFGADVTVEGDGWLRGTTLDDQILGVAMLSPEEPEVETGDDGYPFVHIQPGTARQNMRFVNVLVPTDEAAWDDHRPTVSMIDDNGEMVEVRIEANDGSGLTTDVLINYAWPTSVVSIGAYEFDGRVAVISRQDNNEMHSLFVYGGTYLNNRADSQILFERDEDDGMFEVIYDGEEVTITSDALANITLYAPGVKDFYRDGALLEGYEMLGNYVYINNLPRP